MRRLLQFCVTLGVIAWLCAQFPKARAIVEAPIQYAHGVASTFELLNLQKAVFACKLLYSRYPTNAELTRYVQENIESRGRSVFFDSWGTRYYYDAAENRFELRSAGPDRTMMTDDDLSLSHKD